MSPLMDFFLQNYDAMIKVALLTFGAIGFFLALRNDIISLRGDISHIRESQKSLQDAFSQLNSILTKVAVQDVRLNMIDKKLDELSHGMGFVK
jgi:hypothetical protein